MMPLTKKRGRGRGCVLLRRSNAQRCMHSAEQRSGSRSFSSTFNSANRTFLLRGLSYFTSLPHPFPLPAPRSPHTLTTSSPPPSLRMPPLIPILVVFPPLVGAACTACLLQSLLYLLLRPLSLSNYRFISSKVTGAFFLVSSFLLETWSSVTFKSYGSPVDPSKSSLIIVNHRSDVDWLIGLAYISRFSDPYPGNVKSIVKASLGRVPIFGYLLRFAEFLFLTRSWAADKDKFLARLATLRDFPASGNPICLVLYPEGTRLTKEKQAYSNQYAKSKGLAPTNNVLLPRYKAFTTIVTSLYDQLDGVLDTTFMFEGDHPTINSTLAGTASSVVHAHVKYYPINSLPQGEEQLEKWLLDRWYEKDQRLQEFNADRSSLGSPNENSFLSNQKPTVFPFYALVALFYTSAAATVYAFSKLPNGLFILFSVSGGGVVLTALFIALNIRPSRKGSDTFKKVQ